MRLTKVDDKQCHPSRQRWPDPSRLGGVETTDHRCHSPSNENKGHHSTNLEKVTIEVNRVHQREKVVGRIESKSLDKNKDKGKCKVAACLEKRVMTKSILLVDFPNRREDDKDNANAKGAQNWGTLPRVWVVGPSQSHAEQYHSDREDDIPYQVESLELFLPGQR